MVPRKYVDLTLLTETKKKVTKKKARNVAFKASLLTLFILLYRGDGPPEVRNNGVGNANDSLACVICNKL